MAVMLTRQAFIKL